MTRPHNFYASEPPGPFSADQIRDGDPYELSNGHAIHCMSGGRRHGLSHDAGHLVLSTDPATHAAPIDLGLAWNEGKNLRAPDLCVGEFDNEPGWEPGVPPLAVEYADRGQNESELRAKIAELLERGVRYLWVVRLTGPLRVEVHQPGCKMQIVSADGELHAPGVLSNPVPVRALVDREAALAQTLRNLLQRQGIESLEAVRAEGEAEGKAKGEAKGQAVGRAESLLHVLHARGWTVDASLRRKILACRDHGQLDGWLVKAVTASSLQLVFGKD